MRDYERTRPGKGVTCYGTDGLTYTGWLISGDKRYYQTPAIGTDGQPLKNNFGLDIQVYVWGAQQLPEWVNPTDSKQVIEAAITCSAQTAARWKAAKPAKTWP